MAAPEWSKGGRVKIERAKEHVDNLHREVVAFLESDSHEVVPENDPDTGEFVLVVRALVPPPRRWGTLIGDTAHNLRSALDYIWRYSWAPTGMRRDTRRDGFPILDSAEAAEARFRTIKKRRHKLIVDLWKAARPYKGGDNHLWALQSVNNLDKHNLLIPAYAAVPSINFATPGEVTAVGPSGTIRHSGGPYQIHLEEAIYPVEDGTILIRGHADARDLLMNLNPEFPFHIAFGEGESIKGKPVIPTLYGMFQAVEDIAEAYLAARLIR